MTQFHTLSDRKGRLGAGEIIRSRQPPSLLLHSFELMDTCISNILAKAQRKAGSKLSSPHYVNRDRDAEVTMDPGTIPDQQQRIVKVAGELA